MTAPSPARRPRPVGIIVGICLLLAAVLTFVGAMVLIVGDPSTDVGEIRRVPAAGGTVVFAEASSYDVYVEFEGSDSPRLPDLRPTVTTNEHRPVEVTWATRDTYWEDGREGARVGEVQIPAPGTYLVAPGSLALVGGPDATYAFADGRGLGGRTVGGLVAMIVSVLLGFAGLVTLVVGIVNAVRRRGGQQSSSTPLAVGGHRPVWSTRPPTPLSSRPGGPGPVMLESTLPPPPQPKPPPPPPAPSDDRTDREAP